MTAYSSVIPAVLVIGTMLALGFLGVAAIWVNRDIDTPTDPLHEGASMRSTNHENKGDIS